MSTQLNCVNESKLCHKLTQFNWITQFLSFYQDCMYSYLILTGKINIIASGDVYKNCVNTISKCVNTFKLCEHRDQLIAKPVWAKPFG